MLNDEGLGHYLSRLPADTPFTTATARSEGVPIWALHELVASGNLLRPIRSAYLPAGLPDTLDLRLSVLGLVVPDGCFVTDHTAAWLHAGNAVLLPNAHLHAPAPDIFRHSKIRALRNPMVRSGERRVRPSDLMSVGGIDVTTPLRTACDLGRLRSRDVAMWGIDSMLGTQAFTLDELLAELPYFRAQRGIVQLRTLAPLGDGGAASFGEAALRLRWHDAGLPRPQCQIPVLVEGRVAYVLDMGLEDLGFAAEYDGEEWHSSEPALEHDANRRTWLNEERNWAIEVFVRFDVFGRKQTADQRLRNAFRRVQALRHA